VTGTAQWIDVGGRHHRPRGVDPGVESPHVDDLPTEKIAAVEALPDGAAGPEDGEDADRDAVPPEGRDEPADQAEPDDDVDEAVTVERPVVVAAAPERAPEPEDPAPEPPAAVVPAAPVEPQPGARGSRRSAVLVAVLAALVVAGLIGWLVVTGGGGGASTAPAAESAPPAPAAFGAAVSAPGSWTVEIDEPRLAAGDLELPASAVRAVQLEVTLTNEADRAQDSGIWSIKATADGRPVTLVGTPAGPEGQVPSRTVRPGSSLRLTVTVPMPEEQVDLQLEVVPAGGADPVLFVGEA
jgi:hypothetical protein